MKSYRKELWSEVPTRRAVINITPEVNDCLRESGITEGLVLVNTMHITASVSSSTTKTSVSKNFWLKNCLCSREDIAEAMESFRQQWRQLSVGFDPPFFPPAMATA